jgi:hypothetical protein
MGFLAIYIMKFTIIALIVAFLLSLTYIVVNEERQRKEARSYQDIMQNYKDSLNKSYQLINIRARADSLRAANRIVILEDSTNKLIQQLKENDDEKYQIKVETATKVGRVNSLSTDSLALFFSGLVNQN